MISARWHVWSVHSFVFSIRSLGHIRTCLSYRRWCSISFKHRHRTSSVSFVRASPISRTILISSCKIIRTFSLSTSTKIVFGRSAPVFVLRSWITFFLNSSNCNWNKNSLCWKRTNSPCPWTNVNNAYVMCSCRSLFNRVMTTTTISVISFNRSHARSMSSWNGSRVHRCSNCSVDVNEKHLSNNPSPWPLIWPVRPIVEHWWKRRLNVSQWNQSNAKQRHEQRNTSNACKQTRQSDKCLAFDAFPS